MRPPALVALLGVVLLGLWLWRASLFTVSRPGEMPIPLALKAGAEREAVALDVTVPSVPVGMAHLRDGEGVLLVHYWAPWERHGRAQVTLLDSLRRLPGMGDVHVVVATFDPFPSVARFVARQRLRLQVVIDGERHLASALPCPSVPYTYVLDARGRIAVSQPGEVDWLAPATRAVLLRLIEERTEAPARKPAGAAV